MIKHAGYRSLQVRHFVNVASLTFESLIPEMMVEIRDEMVVHPENHPALPCGKTVGVTKKSAEGNLRL